MPFFVANLDYIYDQVPLIPYEVWLKMKPDAKVAPLMEKLAAEGIELSSVRDVRTELVTQETSIQRRSVRHSELGFPCIGDHLVNRLRAVLVL